MSQTGYPPVYVVDTHATTPPPVPPRQSRTQRRSGAVQTLLILLVSLALCGMVIEGCLIYRLYKPESAATGSPSKMISDILPTPKKHHDVLPSKPTAHLTDGLDAGCKGGMMVWSTDAYPILHEIDYDFEKGSLVIQQEGYYYIYSKVCFSLVKTFDHEVHWKTKRYRGESITLLSSRETKSSSNDERSAHKSNSFLGGIFHIYQGDAIFVKVNCSQIVRHSPYENFFGAYMI